MARTALRVIPDPCGNAHTPVLGQEASVSGQTVVAYGPARGHDYVCGACRAPLLAGIHPAQLPRIVVRCAACGACNAGPEPEA